MGAGGTTGSRPRLPPGRWIELPARGRTFVRETAGPRGAPVVVLLHGWTATAALNWSSSFGPLAERFRVIALDHRGHGRGLRTRTPFRLEECADDVAVLLDELGIASCLAVGYSMGGSIAQLLSRRHPRVVDGLVLCATSTTFNCTAREQMLFHAATGGSVVAGMIPVRRLVAAGALAVCRQWQARRGGAWWGLDEVAGHDWWQIIEAGRELGRFDSSPWIGDVPVPAAVIATRNDDVVPFARQLALAAAIPETTLRVVDGGHAVCTAAPARFVPVLVDACTEVAERAAGRGASLPVDDAA